MQQAIQYIRKLIYHLYLIKHDVVEIFVCYLLLDVFQQIIWITQFLIGTIIDMFITGRETPCHSLVIEQSMMGRCR